MSGLKDENSHEYLRIPQQCEELADCCRTTDIRLQQQGGFRQWLRANFLKVAQMLLLIDIAILLTIDVTATIAARVRRSKTCSHQAQGP